MTELSHKKNLDPAQEGWSSARMYTLAVAGAAISLSNVSLYPLIIAQYGGFAFLLLYVICLLLISLPMMMLEMIIGRAKATNPVDAIKQLCEENKASRHWSIVAIISILASLLILSFYSVIAGWSAAYMFRMLGGVFSGESLIGANEVFNSLVSDPERLIAWHTLFIVITGYIVANGIRRGIEKWLSILMPLFLIVLLLMILTATLTDRFAEGVSYLFNVNFAQIINPEAILAAMGMAFFSLGLGRGAIMAFSAYMPKEASITRTATSVVALDVIVVLLAGIAIFPIVLSAGFIVNNEDSNLIFEILPLALAAMPLGNLLGFLFFLMMLIAAMTSAIALLEPVVMTMIQKSNLNRKRSATKAALIVWWLGLGTIFSFNIWSNYTWTLEADFNQLQLLLFKNQSFFDIVEYLSSKVMVPISSFLLAIFAGHFISKRYLETALNENQKTFKVWYFILHYLTPFALFFVLLNAIGFLS